MPGLESVEGRIIPAGLSASEGADALSKAIPDELESGCLPYLGIIPKDRWSTAKSSEPSKRPIVLRVLHDLPATLIDSFRGHNHSPAP